MCISCVADVLSGLYAYLNNVFVDRFAEHLVSTYQVLFVAAHLAEALLPPTVALLTRLGNAEAPPVSIHLHAQIMPTHSFIWPKHLCLPGQRCSLEAMNKGSWSRSCLQALQVCLYLLLNLDAFFSLQMRLKIYHVPWTPNVVLPEGMTQT